MCMFNVRERLKWCTSLVRRIDVDDIICIHDLAEQSSISNPFVGNKGNTPSFIRS